MADADNNELTAGAIGRFSPFSLTIADPFVEDTPLVFVSDAFERLTGYARSSVIGRNCRFLQGEDTDPETVKALHTAIDAGKDIEVDIYNYRADGSGFWNRLMLGPMLDSDGEVRYFVGIQREVDPEEEKLREQTTDDILAEIQHRVKNHLAMVVGMIRLQARNPTAQESFDSLARRVEALQLLYSEMSDAGAASATDKDVPLGAYLTRIASAISHIDGRESIRGIIDADAVEVPVETAARTGLVFSEILTNALQHGFDDEGNGVVEARSKMLSSNVLRISIMDDGKGMPEDCDWPENGNLGARIVKALVKGLNGKLSVERGVQGTTISLDIPLTEQEEIIEQEHAEA